VTALELTAPFHERDGQISIDLPGARAVFTTRRGGVSEGPYDSLNLGLLTDDDAAHVQRNRASLAAQLGVEFAYARQVHGNIVHTVTAGSDPQRVPPDGDGVATDRAGIAPLVLAADCVPVAIAAPGAVAMVHAGWQGLYCDVIASGAAAVRALSGDAEAPLTAAIGPAAGVCCYEVGEELHARFASRGEDLRDGANLDLKAIAAAQLRAAGAAVVHDVGLCTICSDPTLLFSHRRDDGVTGRQAGIAWLT
jgi:YfiH family protein